MMHNFPPNTDWRLTTLLATVLGYLACGDFTAYEQFAIGNWIIQIGQTVLTNANYQRMIEARLTGDDRLNLNSRIFKSGGSPFYNSPPPPNFEQFYEAFRHDISDAELANLHQAIKRINEELEKLRTDFKK